MARLNIRGSRAEVLEVKMVERGAKQTYGDLNMRWVAGI